MDPLAANRAARPSRALAPGELALGLAPGLLMVLLIALCWPVVVDDAYISLRCARVALETGLLSFDAGERIEAYSNFSQVVLALGLLRAGLDPVPVLQALGAAAALATLPLAHRLARHCGASPGDAALAVLLLSLHAGTAFWATAGLETPFYTLLLTGGVLCFARDTRRGDLAGALLLVAASLTRTEGPAMMAAVGLHRAVSDWRRGRGPGEIVRRNAGWALLFLALYGAYFAWRWNYYGHLFPSPVYFKRGAGPGGFSDSYTAGFLRANLLLVAVAACAPLFGSRRATLPLAVLGAFLAVFAAARRWVLGDVGTMGFFERYFVPALPCTMAAAAAALTRIRGRPGGGRAVAAALTAALVLWQGVHPEASWFQVRRYVRGHPPAVQARNEPAARYLTERFGAAGRIVIGDVGLVGYRFPGTVWDLFGLTDYAFTRERGADPETHVRALLARDPDAWVLCRNEETGEPCHRVQASVTGLPAFRDRYVRTRTFGREVVPSHYFEVYERASPR